MIRADMGAPTKRQCAAIMTRVSFACLLCVTGLSVSSAQTVELNYIVGQSVVFQTAVKTIGTLSYTGDKKETIGDVTDGQFKKFGNRDRVTWDSSTGLFSIAGLKMEDSGLYEVLNPNHATPRKTYQYQLKVYIPVSIPLVNITQDIYPCTIQCTVERGTGVTLSWYREGETKIYASSPVHNAPYAYPVPVERSGTYTCEAKNSVSRETTSLPVGEHCSATEGLDSLHIILIVAIPVIVLLCLVVIGIMYRFLLKKRNASRGTKA